jgi:serine phosphatase RsbU (regulator of sigma subunit)/pSer/pThr/pTyr-binding forkhead associated (FHA) protein
MRRATGDEPMPPHLLILKGANQGQRIPLDGDRTILGRDPSSDVVIGGTAVSRRHATILRQENKFQIVDGDGTEPGRSRNGTFVNNEAVPPAGRVALKNNDRIKICDFLCTFHDAATTTTEVKPKPPLPAELRPEEPEPVDEADPTSSIEAAVSHLSSNILLETQPAEKLKSIIEISRFLSRTLELDTLLPKIVDSLFTLYKQADRGFVVLWDEASKRPIPKVIKTRRPQDEANARFSRSIVKHCLQTVQALLLDDALNNDNFKMSQSIADFSIRSVMCAPLWTQENKAFGVIQLDTQDRRKKFTEDDLQLLMGIAAQASVALENAKLHQDALEQERIKRDLELARQVQRSFLPSQLPEVSGYEFYAYYEPALEVSGDYYDVFALPEQRLGIMLGDVAGKGVAAALLMAKFSAEARSCMLTAHDPATAVNQLNGIMAVASADRFVTLAAIMLDQEAHTATMVNAGHPSPLVRRAATNAIEEATPKDDTGLPIGVFDGYEYTACQVRLEPGDSVIVFSDGVSEAMDVHDHQFSVKGICAALEGGAPSLRALGERLVRAVKQHAAGRSQNDDITLVCFGRTA